MDEYDKPEVRRVLKCICNYFDCDIDDIKGFTPVDNELSDYDDYYFTVDNAYYTIAPYENYVADLAASLEEFDLYDLPPKIVEDYLKYLRKKFKDDEVPDDPYDLAEFLLDRHPECAYVVQQIGLFESKVNYGLDVDGGCCLFRIYF